MTDADQPDMNDLLRQPSRVSEALLKRLLGQEPEPQKDRPPDTTAPDGAEENPND